MDDLIARQRPGIHPGDDNRWPIIGPDLVIRLAPDESARWWGSADVSMLRYNRSLPGGGDYEYAWSLLETAEVLITNTRLVYRANTLTKKPSYFSGVRAGAASALAGGTPRLSPNAYVGQIRFEWVTNVMLRLQRKLRISFATVMLTVLGAQALPMRLVLTFHLQPNGMSEPGIRAFADALVDGVATHRRASQGAPLTPTDLAATKAPVMMTSGLLRWDIPGSQPVVPPPDGQAAELPAILTPLEELTQAINALGLPG